MKNISKPNLGKGTYDTKFYSNVFINVQGIIL